MNGMQRRAGAYIANIIRLMRPKHYIKNLLIFVSIVFDRALFDPLSLLRVLSGFIAFSLLTSVVYIINDIKDAHADRQHELKRFRPIASGAVSVPAASVIAGVLLIISFGINAIAEPRFGSASLIMLAYLAVNLGYSMGLKHIPLLDVVLLVAGFLLRVLYGSALMNSEVSAWVYLTVITLSFYLGLGKRRNELKKIGGGGAARKVLQFYSYEFLDKFMYLCLTCAIVFYALWSADTAIAAKYNTDKLVWTVPLVIVLLMKYSADIESDSYGDPVDVVIHDKVLLVLSGVFAIVMLLLIYYPLGLSMQL